MLISEQKKIAVLCDLDGTLVDSAPDLGAALNQLLEKMNRPKLPISDIKPMIGDGIAKFVERGLNATGGYGNVANLADHIDQFSNIYDNTPFNRTSLYPGVEATLSKLKEKGCQLAVATNKPAKISKKLLISLSLFEYFDALAGGDSYEFCKPHPGHLLHLLEELQVEPENAVMVGDSAHDVAASRGACMPIIIMSYGYGSMPKLSKSADVVLDDFTEIPSTLERFFQ